MCVALVAWLQDEAESLKVFSDLSKLSKQINYRRTNSESTMENIFVLYSVGLLLDNFKNSKSFYIANDSQIFPAVSSGVGKSLLSFTRLFLQRL